MTDWQPIDTAPKDGTHILGYGHYQWGRIDSDHDRDRALEHGDVGPVIMKWDAEDLWDEGEPQYYNGGGWITVTNNPYEDGVIPTHWMPLPSPPSEGEGGG